ncbi:MAG: tetratricopeptide repeat protein [Bacteroidales bacterium]|nr:tetratricopeptide repeat protein [Bacteroidales bacterium]
MNLHSKNAIVLLIVAVGAIFAQTLRFGFTNWDDPDYVTRNELIRSFDFHFIQTIFTTPMHGHYHPFTWLSLAFDYQLFQLNAWGYHLHNLILHLINVILVFLLTKHWSSNVKIAFFTALLFGIHPFVNESVSWITERKNLLFVLYYLGSLIYYVKYLENRKWTYWGLSFLIFIFSLLSKGSAITLPLILLVMLYVKDKFNKIEFMRWLPFGILAVVFAVVAIKAQQLIIPNESFIPFHISLAYSSWAFFNYILKAFIPFQMSTFHPIVLKAIPIYYYLGFIFFFLCIYGLYRFYRLKKKFMFLGLFFFIIQLIMFLKVFNAYASSYFMAERYTYLAYVGLYFAFFTWFFSFSSKYKIKNWYLVIWILFLSFSSYSYAKAWNNSESLWQKVLNVYPNSDVAKLNYGNALRQNGKYQQAISIYNKVLPESSLYSKMLENRAFVYYQLKQYGNAINDYSILLQLNPHRKEIKQTIATILLQNGNIQVAYNQLLYLIKEDSTLCDAWNLLGNIYTSRSHLDSAILAYDKALKCGEKPLYYYNRATMYSMNNRLNEALNDFNKAILLDSMVSDYYSNRGITYFKAKNYKAAIKDFKHAILLNENNIDYHLNLCNVYVAIEDWQHALIVLNRVIELSPNDGEILARRSFVYEKLGFNEKACNDIKKAIHLGKTQYESWAQKICK